MDRREIAITAGAAIVAFVVAFGIGKLAGGGEEATAAPPGEPAAAFDVPAVSITADVESGALPALRPEPTPEPEETPQPESSAPAPSTTAPAPASTAPAPEPEPGPVTGGGED